jgi:hypothetical protein
MENDRSVPEVNANFGRWTTPAGSLLSGNKTPGSQAICRDADRWRCQRHEGYAATVRERRPHALSTWRQRVRCRQLAQDPAGQGHQPCHLRREQPKAHYTLRPTALPRPVSHRERLLPDQGVGLRPPSAPGELPPAKTNSPSNSYQALRS